MILSLSGSSLTTSQQDDDDDKKRLNELFFFVIKHMNEISRVQIDGLALSQTSIKKNAFQMSFWHESGYDSLSKQNKTSGRNDETMAADF